MITIAVVCLLLLRTQVFGSLVHFFMFHSEVYVEWSCNLYDNEFHKMIYLIQLIRELISLYQLQHGVKKACLFRSD